MIIDTNILIAYLNGEEEVIRIVTDWQEKGRTLAISSITFAEVLSFPKLTTEEIKIIKDFLSLFFSIPLDNELAEISAMTKRRYNLELPDAIIAATALKYNSLLVTRDHTFQKIKELTVIEI